MKPTYEQICYFCGKPATSQEHVPPKCIFPEEKDFPGHDFRKNLITVSSCDKHNVRKSKDDEFLMACLTPVVGNNAIGFLQTHRKLNRALNRREKLFRAVMKNVKSNVAKTKDGIEFPVLIGEPDIPRLIKTLEAVARGLYYFERKEIFVGKCTILPMFIEFDHDLEVIKGVSKFLMEEESKDWPTAGHNPEIFKYLLRPPDPYGLIPMSIVFFGGAEIFVAFQPEGVELPFPTLDEATKNNPIKIRITESPDK